jgi:hypothetical protein
MNAALRGLSSTSRTPMGVHYALVVSQSTVKTHLGHILDKLGLRDRVQAVVFGYEHGLAEPGAG